MKIKKSVKIFIVLIVIFLLFSIIAFISGSKEIECKRPYIKYKGKCCIDENKNKICDFKEEVEEKIENKTIREKSTSNITTSEKVIGEKIAGLYAKEIVELIRPEETEDFINGVSDLTGDSKNDILTITKALDSKVNCATCSAISCKDSWKTPKEALKEKTFDSDNYGITLLSAFKKYKPSLNCYNLILTGNKGGDLTSQHLTTYCKEGNWNYLASCDVIKNSIISVKDNFLYGEFISFHMAKNSYYSLEKNEKVYVIDDYWYTIYDNSSELAEWMMNL